AGNVEFPLGDPVLPRRDERDDGIPYRFPHWRSRTTQQIAWLERCPEQFFGAWVGHGDSEIRIHGEHAGRNVREHLRGTAARLLERALAAARVGRHAPERR